MITVETLLLVGLGLLIAGLIVLLLAPTYWARAVRITSEQLRAALPVSEAEIRAEHGRLRAGYALTIHDLKSQLDRLQSAASHRRIEVSRRDAQIAELKRRIEELETALEVNENARLVLEHTITERVPDVERHLREAQRTLDQRDRELARLKVESAKAYRALQEAIDIGDQQRAEIAQLRERVETRSFRNASSTRSEVKDAELALRAELEQLRSRSRAQQLTIEELTRRLTSAGESVEIRQTSAAKAAGEQASSANAGAGQRERESNAAGKASAAPHTSSSRNGSDGTEMESTMILELQQQLNERDTEIAGLQDLVDALEQELAERQGSRFGSLIGQRSTRDARVTDLENKLNSEKSKVRSLQAELAATNDKLARQAAHFMEEFRRLGGRRGTTGGRSAEKSMRQAQPEARRPTLRERIADELEKTPAVDAPAEVGKEPVVQEALVKAADGVTAKLSTAAPLGENGDQKEPVRSGLMARISNLDQAD